jgi:hypothetical protein
MPLRGEHWLSFLDHMFSAFETKTANEKASEKSVEKLLLPNNPHI